MGHPAETADLIVAGGTLLTMDASRTVHDDGLAAIRGDRLIWVGPAADVPLPPDARVIDAGGGLILPGLVNAHTHISMSFFRTLADDKADRLKKYLFPLEKKFVTAELVHQAALHSLAEMIEGGSTTFADMYYFEEEVARATDIAGIRGILGETVVDFPAPDAPRPYGGFAVAEALAARFRGHPRITPALAPHAPYTLDDEHLRLAVRLAEDWDVPLLSHLAEMPWEVAQLRESHGLSPTAYYDSLGLLNRRFTAAHVIFADADDISVLLDRDAGVCHNVVANLKGGKPVAPALEMFDRGLRIGLGTDGPMSGNTQDVIGLLGYVAKIHKLDRLDRTVMTPEKVVEMATIGGARALHREDEIGSLEAGKKADLITLSLDAPALFPMYDPYAALVYGASPRDVRTVIVDGQVVMADRRITTFDKEAVRREGKKMVADIRRKLPDL